MQLIRSTLLALLLLQLVACKKDNVSSANPPGNSGKRISVLYNYEYNGTIWQRNGYLLLNIDHADNKDKSYMIVDIQNSTSGYKFIPKKGPLPIDSLAVNWPADVRFAAFGYGNDFIIDANMRMQVESFSGNRWRYRYDSIYKFSSAIYTYNYLNNAHFMPAAWPESHRRAEPDIGYMIPTANQFPQISSTILKKDIVPMWWCRQWCITTHYSCN